MTDIIAEADLIPETEYLAFRGISKRSAANERAREAGPPFIRIGNRIFYKRDGLREWIELRTVNARRASTLIDGRRRRKSRDHQEASSAS